MSPAPLDEPIHRTNINLYRSDVEAMERMYGRGWTEVVRNLVRQHVKHKAAPRDVWGHSIIEDSGASDE